MLQVDRSVLQLTKLDLHELLRKEHFAPGSRPTLQVVVVCGGAILMVLPKKAEMENEFIFPQEGLSIGNGANLCRELERGCLEELNIQSSDFDMRYRGVLSQFLNPIPDERQSGCDGFAEKDCVVVLASVRHEVIRQQKVRLNHENKKFLWVRSSEEFHERTAGLKNKRPVKYQAMTEVVLTLFKKKIIPWEPISTEAN